jgi:hypothetical protein
MAALKRTFAAVGLSKTSGDGDFLRTITSQFDEDLSPGGHRVHCNYEISSPVDGESRELVHDIIQFEPSFGRILYVFERPGIPDTVFLASVAVGVAVAFFVPGSAANPSAASPINLDLVATGEQRAFAAGKIG